MEPSFDNQPKAFLTTHWSVISKAKKSEDLELVQNAMSQLCENYWYPVYAFIRRKGYQAGESEDLTQSFFLNFIEKPILDHVSPEKGRFRTFLLVAVKNFLANEYDKSQAQKRGGGKAIISLDASLAEQWFESERSLSIEPEAYFDRQWAIALLRHVFDDLQKDYALTGKRKLFNAIKDSLNGYQRLRSYAEIGKELNMKENAVKVAVHRLKSRYRTKLKKYLADTLNEDIDITEELNYLISCL